MDGYNENDFDSLDIYDFSWEGIDESLATNEISHLNSMILNVANLVDHMCYNSDFSNTSTAYNQLRDQEIGRNKPTWYHELSLEKQKKFDLGLSYQKDASQLVKPLDQMMLLMMKIPLLESYRIVRLTMTLDDMGFDDSFWEQINSDLVSVSDLLNKPDSSIETRSKEYYRQNHGKISETDLLDGYQIARRKDYITAFQSFCARAQDSFRVNEAGHGERKAVILFHLMIFFCDAPFS